MTRKRTIMQPTVVRESFAGDPRGQWWVMNKRETGWASYAYPHPTFADVLDKWAVRVVGAGVDSCGAFMEVVPA